MRNQHLALFALFTAAACGGSNNMNTVDMAKGDAGAPAPDMVGLTPKTYKYVSDQIILPASGSFYATDVNGDGKAENSFGNIVNVLNSQMIDLQTTEKANIAAGDGLNLFAFTTLDPTLKNDTAASATSYEAVKTSGAPDFSGSGQFVVEMTVPKAILAGTLTNGTFQSADPLTLSNPPTAYVRIVLGAGDSVNMPIYGTRIKFDVAAGALLKGQLNGAMRKVDIETILIPSLTSAMDKIAHTMPCPSGSSCDQVLMFFDTNMDGTVSLDEVKTNSVVVSLLKPDVQLFDMDGKWKPNNDTANDVPDSLSFGVAFTAVKATFTEP